MMKRMLLILCFALAGLSACASGSDNKKDESGEAMGSAVESAESGEEKAQELEEQYEEAAQAGVTRTAVAPLESRSDSDVTGQVTFTETVTPGADGTEERQVLVTYEVHGLTPDEARGFHIHEVGDCSAPDATSAGGHFNPTGHDHGAPDDADSHAGDLGNITADAEGNAVGSLEGVTKFTLEEGAPTNIVGRAVIVHAGTDDLESQPTGDAGGRVACGVIATQE